MPGGPTGDGIAGGGICARSQTPAVVAALAFTFLSTWLPATAMASTASRYSLVAVRAASFAACCAVCLARAVCVRLSSAVISGALDPIATALVVHGAI